MRYLKEMMSHLLVWFVRYAQTQNQSYAIAYNPVELKEN